MGGAFAIPCQAREQFAIVCCSIESNQTTYSHEENSYHRRDRLCRVRFSERSISRGHQVKAIVRDPSKLTLIHPHLKVVGGNVTDTDFLSRELAKSDAGDQCF